MKKWLFVVLLIIIAMASRWIPHPPNFSPILSLGLFAGALFNKKWQAYAIPLFALIVTDVFLGWQPISLFVYFAFALITLLGMGLLSKQKFPLKELLQQTLMGSLVFFVITNFAVWALGYYPMTWSGLVQCFVAALPFYKNTLLSGVLYSLVFFGAYYLAFKKEKSALPVYSS